MSGTKDLKELLDKLKVEIGPPPPPQAQPERETPRPVPGREAPQPASTKQDRFYRQLRPPEQRPSSGGLQSSAWSENKESMLFGMLASLTATLSGILAGFEYLVLIGAVVFSLFSIVMLLTLLRVALKSGRNGESSGLADRVDALSRKVEMLSSRAAGGGGGPSSAGNPDKERELEQKVEELRVLVKTLAKAVKG